MAAPKEEELLNFITKILKTNKKTICGNWASTSRELRTLVSHLVFAVDRSGKLVLIWNKLGEQGNQSLHLCGVLDFSIKLSETMACHEEELARNSLFHLF